MSAENTARATRTSSHRVGKLVAAFPLGKIGNPAGKPKEIREVIALARTYTPEAIRGLADIARDTKKAPAAARVMAWNSLLDRAWGKPVQPTVIALDRGVAAPVDMDQLTDEQREVLESILLLTGATPELQGPEIEGETLAAGPAVIEGKSTDG
jgi:hypothetical protein